MSTPAILKCFEQPVPYARAVLIQEALVERRIADDIPDTFLLLQHTSVITLGRRGRREHILVPDELLSANGTEIYKASRGGDVTWHGPGQWVLYPILKLGPREMGTHGYLHALEEIAIQTALHFGIDADRKDGMAGAWANGAKFAAIGFRFKKWVSYHGMSLNVTPDLKGFSMIVGCGLVGQAVTSFSQILEGSGPSMEEVQQVLIQQVALVMQREWIDDNEFAFPEFCGSR